MEVENATNQGAGQDVESCRAYCCRKLLFLAKLLLTVVCFVYMLYLIGLLAYLKNDASYLFLGFFPMFFYLILPCLRNCKEDTIYHTLGGMTLHAPAACVVFYLQIYGFSNLIRVAYYHRQPEDFIGPQFIIASLQVSIVLIFFNIFLQKGGSPKRLYKYKDTLYRIMLDFFDIFNFVELLSADECVGMGSFVVTEYSDIEKVIQVFCSLSFHIFWPLLEDDKEDDDDDNNNNNNNNNNNSNNNNNNNNNIINNIINNIMNNIINKNLTHLAVIVRSWVFQNIPFLVIRIIVWVRFKSIHWNSLGFLLKNLMVIVIQAIELCGICCWSNNAQGA